MRLGIWGVALLTLMLAALPVAAQSEVWVNRSIEIQETSGIEQTCGTEFTDCTEVRDVPIGELHTYVLEEVEVQYEGAFIRFKDIPILCAFDEWHREQVATGTIADCRFWRKGSRTQVWLKITQEGHPLSEFFYQYEPDGICASRHRSHDDRHTERILSANCYIAVVSTEGT